MSVSVYRVDLKSTHLHVDRGAVEAEPKPYVLLYRVKRQLHYRLMLRTVVVLCLLQYIRPCSVS